jgi:PKD repeat protein
MVTGTSKTYNNSEGTAFLPIQDHGFEACGAASVTVAPAATTVPAVTVAIVSPAAPVAGDTVSFQATATGLTGTVGYLWDFGDTCPPIIPGCTGGGPVSGAADGTASHLYTDPGTYTVSVTASSGATSVTAYLTLVLTGSTSPKPSAAYSIPSGATRNSISAPWSTAVSQTVTFTALETHAASWDWDFGDGSTASGQTVTHAFTAVGNPTVTLTVTGDGTTTVGTSTALIRFAVSDPYTLRLNNDRFVLTVDWATGTGSTAASGKGTAVDLTADTGYFWFFSSTNTEVIVKVLDACTYDGHFWVFASGLTNLGVTLKVTDSQDVTSQTYTNPDGTSFLPVQDFTTFHACGGN